MDHPESAREWMEHFALKARSRPGQVIDVHYKTYGKPKSWAKSTVTVTWKDGNGIRAEQIGPQLRTWNFPADPAVPWMAIAADPKAVIEHLPVPGVSRVSIEVLTYRPENRLTARYFVTTDSGVLTLYGKTYSDDRGKIAADRLHYLHDLGFPIAKPLGYSPAIRTVWQESFGGGPLLGYIGGQNAAGVLAQAAGRLLSLHMSGLTCPPRPTLLEQHADLAKKMVKLGMVSPEHHLPLQRMVQTLHSAIAQLPPVPDLVVHGDFHIRQMMVRDGDVALFDFDSTGTGDPAEDFGHFIADLHGYNWPAARVEELANMLMDAYAEQSGRCIPADRLRWHTAVQLLSRAYRALLQLLPEFDERVAHYLSLAESLTA